MLKDIVVYVTGGQEDGSRIGHAAALATGYDVSLTAVHLNKMPELIAPTDYLGAGYLQTVMSESQERSRQAHEELRRRLSGLTVPHDLRQIEGYPGRIGDALAAEVRTSDLFVGTLPYADRDRSGHIEEAVLFKSGRGCLFVPTDAPVRESYDTIFLAWKNTREAARAAAEALPFLQRAALVIIGVVEESGASEQYGETVGTDIARYLSRHEVTTELRAINGWSDAGEALLNEAEKTSAQMIVMGGYGHSRFREWVLGGVTRHVMTHARVPVLTAH
ncbi:MAG TPA: universal stress protein [Devosiaceae bacterium]|nr:universal stress protein [Devosiaceae bacterium]